MKILKAINDRSIELFLKLCIVFGIVLHIVPFFYNRSLRTDEAMLVSSICTRSFSELVASPLDWGQSAPVGWLYIVKLITMLWNTSEAALRSFSLISALGCMYLIYALLRNRVAPKFMLWGLAVFSWTAGYIYFANDVKPYMSDNMFCLLVLLLWQKYRENKIELYKFCLIYAVIVWFSFSAVFFMGACMFIECIHQIRTHENLKKLLNNGIFCSIVLVSLLVNYAFWLSSTSSNAGDAGYWNLLRFPLIPTSLADVKLMVRMYCDFFGFYPTIIKLFLTALFVFYVFLAYKKQKDCLQILLPFIVAIVFLLIASSVGYYPITGRLVQIVPIVVLIIDAVVCDFICKYLSENKKMFIVRGVVFLNALVLMYVGMYGFGFLFEKNVINLTQEVSANMDYLRNNLKDDDAIYVYQASIPIFSYEIDYKISYADLFKNSPDEGEHLVLPKQIDKIIYGQSLVLFKHQKPYSYAFDVKTEAVKQDANLILKNNSVYLFTSHGERGVSELITLLRQSGRVETVVDFYKTRLYHFVRDM